MAVLSQTPANVHTHETSQSKFLFVQFGDAVTAGMPVYKNGNKYYPCINTSEAAAAAVGIAVTPNATDGYGFIQRSGEIDLGATLTVTETYIVSSTSGAIEPVGDKTTNDWITVLGTASAADKLELKINATGAQVP